MLDKKIFSWNPSKAALLMVASSFLATTAATQELPRPSPKASVAQIIGLTTITITYSSPGVKGRKIWDALVPYKKVWRTGANEATTISFSDDVKIDGNSIASGTYALFTIPSESEWTVIFNKKYNQWGTFSYDQKDDLLRIKVKPENACEFRERLAFFIEPTSDQTGEVTLHWEKVQVSFNVQVDLIDKALENIKNALNGTEEKWKVLYRGAEFCLNNNVNLDQAMQWINESIELKQYYYNYWVKAQLLARQNNFKAALDLALKAKQLGDTEKNRFYLSFFKATIEESIAQWKKK